MPNLWNKQKPRERGRRYKTKKFYYTPEYNTQIEKILRGMDGPSISFCSSVNNVTKFGEQCHVSSKREEERLKKGEGGRLKNANYQQKRNTRTISRFNRIDLSNIGFKATRERVINSHAKFIIRCILRVYVT